eukprot:3709812-Alexandrium_andersonii.AAC.1
MGCAGRPTETLHRWATQREHAAMWTGGVHVEGLLWRARLLRQVQSYEAPRSLQFQQLRSCCTAPPGTAHALRA